MQTEIKLKKTENRFYFN